MACHVGTRRRRRIAAVHTRAAHVIMHVAWTVTSLLFLGVFFFPTYALMKWTPNIWLTVTAVRSFPLIPHSLSPANSQDVRCDMAARCDDSRRDERRLADIYPVRRAAGSLGENETTSESACRIAERANVPFPRQAHVYSGSDRALPLRRPRRLTDCLIDRLTGLIPADSRSLPSHGRE